MISFVILSYGDIQWGEGAGIGLVSEESAFDLPGSFTPASVDIDTISNVGVPGLHVFRVDQDTIMEPTSNYTGKYLAHTNLYIYFFIIMNFF